VLGRCRRSVLLFDHGRYRNAASRSLHGFLTRDGTSPSELRRIAHEELARYPSVTVRRTEVQSAQRFGAGFRVRTSSGEEARCRKLILATGVVDVIPSVPGLRELIGLSAFHCPYCDGWEVRDQPLIAYAQGDGGARFALGLKVWSQEVTLCTNAGAAPGTALTMSLMRAGIEIRPEAIERCAGDGNRVEVHFRGRPPLHGRALFYSVGCSLASDLALQLGAITQPNGSIEVGRHEDSSVAGLYVVGDASRDALQAIVAAGEGSKAAVAINSALSREDLWQDAHPMMGART